MFKYLIAFLILCAWSTSAHASDITMRHHFAPSPDGQHVAFHARGAKGFNSVYVSKTDGSQETLLFGTQETIEQEPRWSPDGNWIAFVSGTAYEPAKLQLAIVRPDGTGYRILTQVTDGMVKGPSWSPASDQILFEVRDQKAGKATLHIVDLKTNTSRQLTHRGMIVQPEWAPDGGAIIAAIRDPKAQANSDIWILGIEHPDHRRRWTHTPEGETMPVWAPNGQSIYFSRPVGKTGQHDLFQLVFETKEVKRLTATEGIEEFFPIPTPDGSALLYDAFTMLDGKPHSSMGRLELAQP